MVERRVDSLINMKLEKFKRFQTNVKKASKISADSHSFYGRTSFWNRIQTSRVGKGIGNEFRSRGYQGSNNKNMIEENSLILKV